MPEQNVTMDGETAGIIERLNNWPNGWSRSQAGLIADTIQQLTRLSVRAHNWRARAEARHHHLISALDSTTIEALAKVFRRNSSASSLSSQVAAVLWPRLYGDAAPPSPAERDATALADAIETRAKDVDAPAFEDIIEENWKAIVAGLRCVAEISRSWQTLEEHGFPPEACGWPQKSIVGELPNAIDCAIDCLVRQREELLKEIMPLRVEAASGFGLGQAAEIVGNMRQSEAGIFDAAHSGQRGEDRSNALYDAYQAIKAAIPAAVQARKVASDNQELAEAGLRHAEGITSQLAKPDWRPGRAHVEQARNSIKKLAEALRASPPAAPAGGEDYNSEAIRATGKRLLERLYPAGGESEPIGRQLDSCGSGPSAPAQSNGDEGRKPLVDMASAADRASLAEALRIRSETDPGAPQIIATPAGFAYVPSEHCGRAGGSCECQQDGECAVAAEPVLLGEGTLTWDGGERRSDRYGSVYLIQDGHTSLTRGPSPSLIDSVAAKHLEGVKGKLRAVVTETRESTHIGDIFRNIGPRTPEVGQVIELGAGMLFTEPVHDGGKTVGLRPDDGRASDWLNPRALYDAHEQSVKLFFYPEDK